MTEQDSVTLAIPTKEVGAGKFAHMIAQHNKFLALGDEAGCILVYGKPGQTIHLQRGWLDESRCSLNGRWVQLPSLILRCGYVVRHTDTELVFGPDEPDTPVVYPPRPFEPKAEIAQLKAQLAALEARVVALESQGRKSRARKAEP